MMLGEGKNYIPAEELDAIFDGASDDKSATNTTESIPVSNSKTTSTNTAKEITYNGNQKNFFLRYSRKKFVYKQKNQQKMFKK